MIHRFGLPHFSVYEAENGNEGYLKALPPFLVPKYSQSSEMRPILSFSTNSFI